MHNTPSLKTFSRPKTRTHANSESIMAISFRSFITFEDVGSRPSFSMVFHVYSGSSPVYIYLHHAVHHLD